MHEKTLELFDRRRKDHLYQYFYGKALPQDAPVGVMLLRQSTPDKQNESFIEQYKVCKEYLEQELGAVLAPDVALYDWHDTDDPLNPQMYVGAFGERVSAGIDSSNRIGLSDLIHYVERRNRTCPNISYIVFYNQSRLTKLGSKDALRLLFTLEDTGAQVALASERRVIDGENTTDQFQYISTAKSNNEINVNLARDTMAGTARAVLAGGWPGGNPPIGYTWDGSRREVTSTKYRRINKTGLPLHEKLIPQLFQMYLDGHPLKAIARYATKEGLRTWPRKSNSNKGGYISIQKLTASILTNEVYQGLVVYPARSRPRYKPTGKRTRVLGWQEDSLVVTHPELRYVTDKVFEAVQKKLEDEADIRGRQKSKHILTGLLRCPVHRTQMYHDGREGEKGRYRCKSTSERKCTTPPVPASVEFQVAAAFLCMTCEEETVRQLVARYQETRAQAEDLVKEIDREIKDIKKRWKFAMACLGDTGRLFDQREAEKTIRTLNRTLEKQYERRKKAENRCEFSADHILELGKEFLYHEADEQNMILRKVFAGVMYDPANQQVKIKTSDFLRNLELTVATIPLRGYGLQSAMGENSALVHHGALMSLAGYPALNIVDMARARGVFATANPLPQNVLFGVKIAESKSTAIPMLRGILAIATESEGLEFRFIEGGTIDEMVRIQQEIRSKRAAAKERLIKPLDIEKDLETMKDQLGDKWDKLANAPYMAAHHRGKARASKEEDATVKSPGSDDLKKEHCGGRI